MVDNKQKEFDQFWKAYPRKNAKLDAMKAWKQTKKVRPALPIVLAAIVHQKASREWLKQDGTFIPYPATWLRAGQWDDEVNTNDEPEVDGLLKPIKWEE